MCYVFDADTLELYRSRLDCWDQRSSVRSKTGVTARPDLDDGLPFPKELLPLASHPKVASQGEGVVKRILGHKLVNYHDFTTHLELEAIVPATIDLATQRLGLLLPTDLSVDATKIATDECFHALEAMRQREHFAELGCVGSGPKSRPAFVQKLQRTIAEEPGEIGRLKNMVFSMVSETLITGSLTRIPNDTSVLPEVREIIREHAVDEAKHHQFFSQLMGIVWPQLESSTKRKIGPLFAEFIDLFLTPDFVVQLQWLQEEGFSSTEAKGIMSDVIEQTEMDSVRAQAKPTLDALRWAGILEEPCVSDALADTGFHL